MPEASGRHIKYHYQDHDPDEVNEAPPVQNTWYPVFDAEDVRLLWCVVTQSNDEVALKDVEVRWTIDGNVYLLTLNAASGTEYNVYKDWLPSAGGTAGLLSIEGICNAGYFVDKRGLAFKVEVRLTGVPGGNQVLICRCVRETVEST